MKVIRIDMLGRNGLIAVENEAGELRLTHRRFGQVAVCEILAHGKTSTEADGLRAHGLMAAALREITGKVRPDEMRQLMLALGAVREDVVL